MENAILKEWFTMDPTQSDAGPFIVQNLDVQSAFIILLIKRYMRSLEPRGKNGWIIMTMIDGLNSYVQL